MQELVLEKGSPAGFELIEKDRGQERVVLFYPSAEEKYTWQRVTSSSESEWILSGPYQIDYREYMYFQKFRKAKR